MNGVNKFPSHYDVEFEKLGNSLLSLQCFYSGCESNKNLSESCFPVCVHSGDGDQQAGKQVRRSRRGGEEKEPVMSNLGKSLRNEISSFPSHTFRQQRGIRGSLWEPFPCRGVDKVFGC